MKKFLLSLAALLTVSTVVFAAIHTATWTKATTNTDGSAIPATGNGSVTTTVEYGTCNADGSGFTRTGDVVADSAGTSATTPNYVAGSRVCHRAYHKNTYGNVSAYSNVIVVSEPTPVPNPPVLTAVN